MASVVLAACRPALYTIVDSRALHTMMLLEGQSPHEIRRIRWFPRPLVRLSQYLPGTVCGTPSPPAGSRPGILGC